MISVALRFSPGDFCKSVLGGQPVGNGDTVYLQNLGYAKFAELIVELKWVTPW